MQCGVSRGAAWSSGQDKSSHPTAAGVEWSGRVYSTVQWQWTAGASTAGRCTAVSRRRAVELHRQTATLTRYVCLSVLLPYY